MQQYNFDNDQPRTPDDQAAMLAWEQGTNIWSEELFRRMNRDEDKVDRMPLPALPDTLEEWQKKRPEILQTFKDVMYGVMPPAPDKLELRKLSERKGLYDGTADRYEYRVICRMDNGREFDFDMLLYVPVAKPAPPVFVKLNFKGNQAVAEEDDVRITRSAMTVPGRWHSSAPSDGKRSFQTEHINAREAVKRGYAVATACYGEIFPDNLDGFRKSIFTLFYDEEFLRSDCERALQELQTKPLRNISAIGGWAWGLSRMADALEQLGFKDFAVLGHSRLGKAALWAGANDERFKLVIANNSGHGGAAPSRHILGETLTMLWCIRSNWFCGNMARYAGLENELPIDQHQLLALIAPRSVYVGSSSLDVVADPKGEFISAKTASKVWELYGLEGLDSDEMPEENQSVGKQVGYHVKTGKHSLTAYDWVHYYNHADKVFGKQQ